MERSAGRSWRRRGRRPGRFAWRWRRNSLRRRTDVVESWLWLAGAVLLCLVPLFGWWSGHSVDRTLQRVVRTQRAARFLVTATVIPAGRAADEALAAAADKDARPLPAPGRSDVLSWTAPDSTAHATAVAAELEASRRSTIELWTDRTGRLVPPPLDSTTAATQSVLAGTAAATSAAGLLLIVRHVLMWRLMRGRLERWEREWARISQDWGRAGAG